MMIMLFLQEAWRGFLSWRNNSVFWLLEHTSLDGLDQPRRRGLLHSLVLLSLVMLMMMNMEGRCCNVIHAVSPLAQ